MLNYAEARRQFLEGWRGARTSSEEPVRLWEYLAVVVTFGSGVVQAIRGDWIWLIAIAALSGAGCLGSAWHWWWRRCRNEDSPLRSFLIASLAGLVGWLTLIPVAIVALIRRRSLHGAPEGESR